MLVIMDYHVEFNCAYAFYSCPMKEFLGLIFYIYSAQEQEGHSFGICQKCSARIYGAICEKSTKTGRLSSDISSSV